MVDKIIIEAAPEQLIQRRDTLYSEIEVIFGETKYEGPNLMSETMLEDGKSLTSCTLKCVVMLSQPENFRVCKYFGTILQQIQSDVAVGWLVFNEPFVSLSSFFCQACRGSFPQRSEAPLYAVQSYMPKTSEAIMMSI